MRATIKHWRMSILRLRYYRRNGWEYERVKKILYQQRHIMRLCRRNCFIIRCSALSLSYVVNLSDIIRKKALSDTSVSSILYDGMIWKWKCVSSEMRSIWLGFLLLFLFLCWQKISSSLSLSLSGWVRAHTRLCCTSIDFMSNRIDRLASNRRRQRHLHTQTHTRPAR